MLTTVTCEECGAPIPERAAMLERADDGPHYFCSEGCKLAWSEEPDPAEELED
jgi:YHS domain-containing protein